MIVDNSELQNIPEIQIIRANENDPFNALEDEKLASYTIYIRGHDRIVSFANNGDKCESILAISGDEVGRNKLELRTNINLSLQFNDLALPTKLVQFEQIGIVLGQGENKTKSESGHTYKRTNDTGRWGDGSATTFGERESFKQELIDFILTGDGNTWTTNETRTEGSNTVLEEFTIHEGQKIIRVTTIEGKNQGRVRGGIVVENHPIIIENEDLSLSEIFEVDLLAGIIANEGENSIDKEPKGHTYVDVLDIRSVNPASLFTLPSGNNTLQLPETTEP